MPLNIRGKTYDIATLDFETAYDVDYTLSKLSTSDYVLDDRFLAFMCGLKLEHEEHVWRGDQLEWKFKQVDWSRTALLAHHTAFDGFILSQRYGIKPAFYLDTLSMARATGMGLTHKLRLDEVGQALGLGGKHGAEALVNTKGKRELTPEEELALARYCIRDVKLCLDVFHKLYDFIPDEELELIDITLRMFCDPVFHIDQKLALEELQAESGKKMRAMMAAGVSAADLMSNDKFAAVLAQRGIQPPRKVSLATGKLTWDFAKSSPGFQALLNHDRKDIRDLADARVKVKSTIGSTRAARFIETAETLGKMPVYLNYYGAHTGRWSGGNKMNLQNLPRGGRLRRALMAPPGHVVCVADSSQIEARINAWFAGETWLVEAFRNGDDIYSKFATELYKRPIDRKRKEIDPETGKEIYPDFNEGFVGKTCILGLGYNMGAAKLHATLISKGIQITEETAYEAVNLYRVRNRRIANMWRKLNNILPRMTLQNCQHELHPVKFIHRAIALPNGMFLRYPNLRVDGDGEYFSASYQNRPGNSRTKIYGGLMCENIVQALARIVIADQIRVMHDSGMRVATSTHDEVVTIIPKKQAEARFEEMLKIMSTPPDWAPDLPLAAEGGWDTCYSK